uniref:Uncharacterized protein n=1 Tax=Aegilops tauschii TaxID=37682 RepID=N1QPG1_AEGTA
MAPPLFSPLASAASSPPPRRRPPPSSSPLCPSSSHGSSGQCRGAADRGPGVQLTAASAGGRWRPQLCTSSHRPGADLARLLRLATLFSPAQQEVCEATTWAAAASSAQQEEHESFLNPMVSIEPQRGSELEMRWGQKILLGWFQGREGKDFLLSAGGERAEIRETKQPEEPENTTHVLCTGHIPHSFCEDHMQGMSLSLELGEVQVSFSSLGLLRRGSVLPRTARTNLILGRQRSDKDENGIPDYNGGGSDMDLLMLSTGILDVLEALPYTRATFGTCVGSSLCQCNLHLSADYGDQAWLLAYRYVCEKYAWLGFSS